MRPPAQAPPGAALITRLQRSAGNAAVARLVLARYEAGEHAQMGEARSITVNTVPMTEGELIALGDFYATAAEMMAADPAELTKLRDLIRQDQDAFMKFPGAIPVKTEDWEEALKGRPEGAYRELLLDNEGHFAPPSAGGSAGGEDHRSLFFSNHGQALERAHAAAATTKTVPDDALALNGFACHFLTDAFSAGHLFNKAEMLGRIEEAWNAIDESLGPDQQNTFTARGVGDRARAPRGEPHPRRPRGESPDDDRRLAGRHRGELLEAADAGHIRSRRSSTTWS